MGRRIADRPVAGAVRIAAGPVRPHPPGDPAPGIAVPGEAVKIDVAPAYIIELVASFP